jgi:hypothetical protein
VLFGRYLGTAKKPEPPPPIVWNIYKFASKAVWLGTVKALDEATAMEKAATEFVVSGQAADGDMELMAIRR